MNKSVFTTTYVMVDKRPITTVIHDEEGDWQFFSDDDAEMEKTMLVSLKQVLEVDASVGQLAGMPQGHQAFRDSASEPWQIVKNEDNG